MNLCYTDTKSFIINIKTEDIFKDIANDVKAKDLAHQIMKVKYLYLWVKVKKRDWLNKGVIR